MDRSRAHRALRTIGAAGAIALFGLSCGKPSESGLLQPGDEAPMLLRGKDTKDTGVTVAWLLRGEDLFGCDPGTSGVRQLQRVLGSRLQFVAIVAEDTEDLASALLRRERLTARIAHTDAHALRNAVARERLPALVLVAGGRIAAIWSSARVAVAAELGTPSDSLVVIARRALASSPPLPN